MTLALSGKGGTGKSTLSAALALTIAKKGWRVLAVAAPRTVPSPLETRHSTLLPIPYIPFPFPTSLCYTFPRETGQGGKPHNQPR